MQVMQDNDVTIGGREALERRKNPSAGDGVSGEVPVVTGEVPVRPGRRVDPVIGRDAELA